MNRRAKLDAIGTVIVGVVLAFAAAYLLLAGLFSGWGDPPIATPSPTATSGPAAWLSSL